MSKPEKNVSPERSQSAAWKILKKQISMEARTLLKDGNQTKQQVFELLVAKHGHARGVSQVLSGLPTQQARKKYAWLNTVSLILVCLMAIVHLGVAADLFYLKLAAYVAIITLVAMKKFQFYLTVGLIYFVLLNSFYGDYAVFTWQSSLILVLGVPTGFALLFVSLKLCPTIRERSKDFVDAEGNERVRIVYDFKE